MERCYLSKLLAPFLDGEHLEYARHIDAYLSERPLQPEAQLALKALDKKRAETPSDDLSDFIIYVAVLMQSEEDRKAQQPPSPAGWDKIEGGVEGTSEEGKQEG